MNDMNIEMPTQEEKNRAITAILDAEPLLPEGKRIWSEWTKLPISVLFFGVEDALFLACVLGVLCLVPAAAAAAQNMPAAPLLFLISPCLYGLMQGLTDWKERMCRTYEWKKSCLISLKSLTALRMLIFGGVSTGVCVPVNVLLRYVSGSRHGLIWMLGLSFSSLFLYAALSLACGRIRIGRAALFGAPAVWVLAGIILIKSRAAADFLLKIPAYVFCITAVLSLGLYLFELRNHILKPLEGGA